MTIYTWSTTADNNATADAGINWAEFQDPDTANNSARTEMARVAAFRDDATKPLRAKSGTALVAGELQAGTIVGAYYVSATDEFLIVNSGFHATALLPSVASTAPFGIGQPTILWTHVDPRIGTVAPLRWGITSMSKLFSRRSLVLVSFVAGAMLVADRARADSYIIDPKHTEVRFAYQLGLSVQRGRFTSVRGTMEFDAKAPEKTRVNAVVKTASLSTGEAAIESELKGRKFFDAERQPEIHFQSQTVQMLGAEEAQVTGTITINGITQQITLHVSIKSGDDPELKYRVGSQRFTAIGQIRRSAFNMTAYRSMVADDVAIEIDALLRKKNQTSSAE